MQLPGTKRERSPLSAEIRHSAMLLGGSLGLMIFLALVMLFVSSRLDG